MALKNQYWRFSDLQDLGIIKNRMTLHRWMREMGFPKGFLLGPNSRAWSADDVTQWIKSREAGPSIENRK